MKPEGRGSKGRRVWVEEEEEFEPPRAEEEEEALEEEWDGEGWRLS